MRLAALLALFGCADPEVTPVESPIVSEPAPPITEAGPGLVAVTGAELRASYLAAVCELHARPACVASRALTCDDGLDLSDPAVCMPLLAGTADVCPGLDVALSRQAAEVQACTAWLRTASCEEQPACSPEGPREAQGPCAAVVALVAASCAVVDDAG